MSIQHEMRADDDGAPFDERTVRAVIALLYSSKHAVHHGAAKRVGEYFLPDGRIDRARAVAVEKGWPLEAVLAGLEITTADGERERR